MSKEGGIGFEELVNGRVMMWLGDCTRLLLLMLFLDFLFLA